VAETKGCSRNSARFGSSFLSTMLRQSPAERRLSRRRLGLSPLHCGASRRYGWRGGPVCEARAEVAAIVWPSGPGRATVVMSQDSKVPLLPEETFFPEPVGSFD